MSQAYIKWGTSSGVTCMAGIVEVPGFQPHWRWYLATGLFFSRDSGISRIYPFPSRENSIVALTNIICFNNRLLAKKFHFSTQLTVTDVTDIFLISIIWILWIDWRMFCPPSSGSADTKKETIQVKFIYPGNPGNFIKAVKRLPHICRSKDKVPDSWLHSLKIKCSLFVVLTIKKN